MIVLVLDDSQAVSRLRLSEYAYEYLYEYDISSLPFTAVRADKINPFTNLSCARCHSGEHCGDSDQHLLADLYVLRP